MIMTMKIPESVAAETGKNEGQSQAPFTTNDTTNTAQNPAIAAISAEEIMLARTETEVSAEQLQMAEKWCEMAFGGEAWVSQLDTDTLDPSRQLLHEHRYAKYPYVCANPIQIGETRRKETVAQYRNFILEFDDMNKDSLDEWIRQHVEVLADIGAYISAMVYSGRKSIHAWLCLSRPVVAEEWYAIAASLKRMFPSADKLLQNAATLSRLPCSMRTDTGARQRILFAGNSVDPDALIGFLARKGVWQVAQQAPSCVYSAAAVAGPVDTEHLISWAIKKAETDGRNNAGFDLACQLRDALVSESDAETVMIRYVERCPQPADKNLYTIGEAQSSLESAYAAPRREPPMTILPAPAIPAASALPLTSLTDMLASLPSLPEPDYLIDHVIENGEVGMLVAASKLRKSFLAKQLSLCVATGQPFLGYGVPRPRRVLYLNYEIKSDWVTRRMGRMTNALGIQSDGENLTFAHLRGLRAGVPAITATAIQMRSELIVIDPVYRIDGAGGECDEQARIRLCEELAEMSRVTGATVLLVHHDPKGRPGDRDIRDRGAGSNIINRFVDCTLTLTAHAEEPDAAVFESLSRNYASRGKCALVFRDGAFFLDENMDTTVETSRTAGNKVQKEQAGDATTDAKDIATAIHLRLATAEKITIGEAQTLAHDRFPVRRGDRALKHMEAHESDYALVFSREKSGRGHITKMQGSLWTGTGVELRGI